MLRYLKNLLGSHSAAATGPGGEPFRIETLTELGAADLEAAVSACRQEIARNPDDARAHCRLGALLTQQKQHDEAQACLKRAIGIAPDLAVAHQCLGSVLEQTGKLPEATECYRKSIELDPSCAPAYLDLGHVLMQQGRLADAGRAVADGIARHAHFAQLHLLAGNLYFQNGKPDMAAISFRRVLSIQPDHERAHNNLGIALQTQGKFEEAIASFSRAAEINAGYIDAHYNMGTALLARDMPDAAANSFQKAIALNGGHLQAHNNLGNALLAQNLFDQARACYRRALDIDPGFAESHFNLGLCLERQGESDQAIACYRRAIEINPGYADAHVNLALLLLRRGEFLTGWREYEYRWGTSGMRASKPGFHQPPWLGEVTLVNRSILLHAEQGLGDTLQFVRYVEQVKALGATVFLQVPAPLISLVASLPGAARVLAQEEQPPAFDFHCPLMSLPLAFKTEVSSIPAPARYLAAPAARTGYWAHELRACDGLRAGLVWSGNPKFRNDRNRSIPLEKFSPLWQNPALHIVSLQKEIPPADMGLLRATPRIMNLADRLGDFSETAAVIENLDLVITVDTSVAHLAGALGKPVWILLPQVADWRWLTARADSPWYPSARLFRQQSGPGWDAVIEEVRQALTALTAAHDAADGR